MATTPEGRVKKKVKEYLTSKGIWFFMPVQTGFGVQGIPDFLCCHGGVFLAIETKAPGRASTLTPWQKLRGEEIQKAGGEYLVVTNVQQLKEWCDAYEIKKPSEQKGLQKRV